MKGRLLVPAVAAALCATGSAAFAMSGAPSVPAVDASAYIVYSPATGKVLAQRRSRMKVPMASLTKMMTVLVALDTLKLDDVVTVSRSAASVGDASANLRPGERITVSDLVTATLVQSANDAAVALADAASLGNRAAFVAAMNAKAKRLGLADTQYTNPDGLDAAGHYSSARDVLYLARVLVQRPDLLRIVRQQTATISGGRVLETWNDLLGVYPGVFGVKTGHTDKAGYCEVVGARRGDTTVYAVVLGSPSESERDVALERLLDYGFARSDPPQPPAAVYPVPVRPHPLDLAPEPPSGPAGPAVTGAAGPPKGARS